MSPTLDAFLRSWPFDPWLVAAPVLPALIYLRGWRVLHRRDPMTLARARLACFLGGLATLFLALASPIEPFADWLLQVHMTQHLLLMMVAPPLDLAGLRRSFPILRGLPGPIRTDWVVPLLRSRLRRLFGRLTHPVVALPVFVASTWLWHVPLALRDRPAIDRLALRPARLLPRPRTRCSGIPVVRPYPVRPRWSPLVAVALPDPRRRAEHRAVGPADVLGPAIYAALHAVPRIGGLSALRRPVGGRRHHVGARLGGVSPAPVRGRGSGSCSGRGTPLAPPS